MTKPQIKEYNCQTQEEITRDANADEIAQIEADAQAYASKQAEAKEKADAKAKAEAKLIALGLDLDDLRVLGL